MDRRLNFLYLIPLGLALVTFLITEQALPTAAALLIGYGILLLLRRYLLPPHIDRAARLYQKGDLEGALDRANQAIEARPERWEGYYIRALVGFSLAEHERAEADARRAIELKPSVANNHAMLGQVLYWQNRFDEALAAFRRAVDLDGRDPMNHFWMGATLYHMERLEQSIPHLELVRRLKIPNPQLELLATYYLGMALQKTGDAEAAGEQFARLKEYDKALKRLKDDLSEAPQMPMLPHLRNEVAAIEARSGKQL